MRYRVSASERFRRPAASGTNAAGKAAAGFAVACLGIALFPLPLQADDGLQPQDGQGASCVDVRIEDARSLSFDCLNAALQKTARAAPPPVYGVTDAVGSGAPDRVGTFSFTATSIRMGANLGHSIYPQRPPAAAYSNGLTGTK